MLLVDRMGLPTDTNVSIRYSLVGVLQPRNKVFDTEGALSEFLF